MKIAKDSVVSVDYTLTDDSGQVIDSSKDKEPLPYLHGHGQFIPGLEKALEGKEKGAEFKVTIPPEEGYGQRIEQMVQDVPKNQFDEPDKLQVGMQFQIDTPQGARVFQITKLSDDAVTIDGNHPLAGVNLNFEVKVADVRAATEEELKHGHVHS